MGKVTHIYSFYHGDSIVEFEVDKFKFDYKRAERLLFENFNSPKLHFGNPIADYVLNCALEIFNNSNIRKVCMVDGVEIVFNHTAEISAEDVLLGIKRNK